MTAGHGEQLLVTCTALEEAVLFSERPGWPLTIELAVEVDGRLDPVRLTRSLRFAIAAHPLAGARLSPRSSWSLTRRWRLPEVDGTTGPTVEVRGVASVGELERLRAWWVSRPFDLCRSAPVRGLLVHAPDRDHLVLSVHHGAMDGVAALRLLRSIAEAYASDAAPLAGADDLAARHVETAEGSPGPGPWDSLRELASGEGAARLAPSSERAGSVGSAYVLADASCDAGWTSKLRGTGSTVNDVLVAATVQACAGWNRSRGPVGAAVSITVPVNARHADARLELVANRSLQATVTVPPVDQTSVERVLARVAVQTDRIRRGTAVEPAARLSGTGWLPDFVRRSIPIVFGWATRDRFQATTRMSNLGRVELLSFGPDLSVRRLVMSPPVRPPQGLATMALTYGDSLFLGVRACRTMFDQDAADEFLRLVISEIGAVVDVVTARGRTDVVYAGRLSPSSADRASGSP